MFNYYWRGDNEEDEIIIQASHKEGLPVSIRVCSEDGENALVFLPAEEIDRMIAGLQALKRKIG